jgi:hypothetical protein
VDYDDAANAAGFVDVTTPVALEFRALQHPAGRAGEPEPPEFTAQRSISTTGLAAGAHRLP